MKDNEGGFLNILLYFIIFVLVLHMSAANILSSRNIPFAIGSFLGFIYFSKVRTIKYSFGFILLFWFMINIWSMLYNGVSFSLFRILIITMNILLLPYFLLAIWGKKVFETLERIVYILTITSLIIYGFNLVFLDFFNSLSNLFYPITTKSLAANPNYWSAFIYVNAFADNGYGIMRNNGFMWEPGGFALMLVWAMVYNAIKNGVRIDLKFLIYTFAIITTFSTSDL